MATMSQITDLIAFAPLNYSGFWLVINWICPFSIQVNYGIDWKHTDFTEKTYSGDNDDSKNKSISWKRGYNYIIIINIAIKYKNTKLRPVNNFFFFLIKWNVQYKTLDAGLRSFLVDRGRLLVPIKIYLPPQYNQ